MSISRNVVVALVVLAVAFGAGVLWQISGTREAAPNVGYTLIDGSRGELQALRGKVVLVNFWATSCTTCVKEMPAITATYEKFKTRGYETVAIAMSYDPPAFVVNFAESRKLPFTVAIDNTGDIAKSFGEVRLTPTTFLIDKRGRIVKRYLGEPDFTELHARIETLLTEQ